jgi:predicted trehalose synthase
MAPDRDVVVELASAYLSRQPWFVASSQSLSDLPVELDDYLVLDDGHPGLSRLLFRQGEKRYQLLMGWRPVAEIATMLKAEDSAAIWGAAPIDGEQVIVYDALCDDALCLRLLELSSAGKEHAQRVRLVSSLVSHAALVFDERLFMKCYRVVEQGPRPEAEMLFALDEVGFNALLAPVARWRKGDLDLALVREFLPSALEGRPLALTSLRDLLGRRGSELEDRLEREEDGGSAAIDEAVAAAGGDFASEMSRLGQTTARLHLGLRKAFGDSALSARHLRDVFASLARRERPGLIEALEAASDGEVGRSIRLHGNYHLRRVMRAETGWLIAGFGDDPMFAFKWADPSQPLRTGSPLEDLADMCVSLRDVAREALAQGGQETDQMAHALAEAWVERNTGAFLRGYRQVGEVGELLPSSPAMTEGLLAGFVALRDSL